MTAMSENNQRRRRRSVPDDSTVPDSSMVPDAFAVPDFSDPSSAPDSSDPDPSTASGFSCESEEAAEPEAVSERPHLPSPHESFCATHALLSSLCEPKPLRKPHSLTDCVNILLDLLLWLPKLAVSTLCYALRYLRSAFRYALEGSCSLTHAFLMCPYAWLLMYVLLSALSAGGVLLIRQISAVAGSSLASSLERLFLLFGGFLLMLPALIWGCCLLWLLCTRLESWCRWHRLVFLVLLLIAFAAPLLYHLSPLFLLLVLPLLIGLISGALVTRRTSESIDNLIRHFTQREERARLRKRGVHQMVRVTEVVPDRAVRRGVHGCVLVISCRHPSTGDAVVLVSKPVFQPYQAGDLVHVVFHPTDPTIYRIDAETPLPKRWKR